MKSYCTPFIAYLLSLQKARIKNMPKYWECVVWKHDECITMNVHHDECITMSVHHDECASR